MVSAPVPIRHSGAGLCTNAEPHRVYHGSPSSNPRHDGGETVIRRGGEIGELHASGTSESEEAIVEISGFAHAGRIPGSKDFMRRSHPLHRGRQSLN